MSQKIRTQRDARFATDHELATQYREAKENDDTTRRNLVVEEALRREISKSELREIQ